VIRFDLESLKDFKGVTRRQEALFKSEELVVLEDFAHHPTAIEHILRSMHSVYPEHEIITCFEPRSNTAKSGLFQDAFTESFKQSSVLMIGCLHRSSLLKDESKLDRTLICSQLNLLGIDASTYDCNDQLLSALIKRLNRNRTERKKSLVIFFTNGSFDGIMQKLVLKLSE
jgi:UDP-N-acetylmuramate: L-alanyl-gamma-D-glutamyl-meso-diaminopimelate ligase